ncbi:PP2C family protein-serine/threonine phosphatase [Saccharothrix mutabilis subsp. mutabilis]|uniref:PP2C family protein-serine/threonine phosphatase n=1 Tax=Saccharothrix mutabilis subsp. mutabilis TaxID=66855 RepID=A0ABN0UFZ6_9PSEU
MNEDHAAHGRPPDHAADRAAEQQRSLVQAWQRSELSTEELWLRYFGLGGEAGFLDVDAYVHGLGGLAPLERDVLAHAVNERLDELAWAHRAGYSRPYRDSTPRSEPFAALVRLLEGSELAPPDRLPAVAEAAAKALGVTITVRLVDYEQRLLRPMAFPGRPTGPAEALEDADTTLPGRAEALDADTTLPGPTEALEVDTTLAGRAYQQVRIFPAEGPGGPRLWVPLLDGAERLGVLEVEVEDGDDLHDPGLRTQCRWLSMLLGHLVTLLSQYGDGVDRTRRPEKRTVNAELIWSLLPPLTAGVDSFVVSGVLEPRHSVSGDAFDYALSETTATLVVLDADGRDVRSGLVAAAALSAHRSARHAGLGLVEQARTMDETLRRQFGGDVSATAVLVELDLATGRLSYLNAGHPRPLVLRGGQGGFPLAGGGCRPLGSGLDEVAVGEEVLRPDDWLVLYTDGVTGASDAGGTPFGEPRLVDFLRREAAAGNPPPETARRLVRAVLAHQGGTLRDDAAVLLARWAHPDRILP